MDINKIQESGVTILTLKGALDFTIRPYLNDLIQAIEKKGTPKLLMMFSEVHTVHTTGLGVLVGIYKEILSKKGELKFACMSPEVFDLFQVTRLVKIFEIYETKEEALKSFHN